VVVPPPASTRPHRPSGPLRSPPPRTGIARASPRNALFPELTTKAKCGRTGCAVWGLPVSWSPGLHPTTPRTSPGTPRNRALPKRWASGVNPGFRLQKSPSPRRNKWVFKSLHPRIATRPGTPPCKPASESLWTSEKNPFHAPLPFFSVGPVPPPNPVSWGAMRKTQPPRAVVHPLRGFGIHKRPQNKDVNRGVGCQRFTWAEFSPPRDRTKIPNRPIRPTAPPKQARRPGNFQQLTPRKRTPQLPRPLRPGLSGLRNEKRREGAKQCGPRPPYCKHTGPKSLRPAPGKESTWRATVPPPEVITIRPRPPPTRPTLPGPSLSCTPDAVRGSFPTNPWKTSPSPCHLGWSPNSVPPQPSEFPFRFW